MTFDPKKAEAYIQKLKKKLHENPVKMDSYERRMLVKHNEASDEAKKADNEVRTLQQQIGQAQARIGSLQVQYADCQGKASAYIEAIIAQKFGDELDDISKPAKSKANGKASKLPGSKKVKKKSRRKTSSKSRSTSASA